jgi:organic radical activating enzyme
MSNRLANGAFCILPFIEQFQDLDGKTRLCCYSAHTIDNIHSSGSDQLRTDIWNGKKISHCESCYKLDEQGSVSPRLVESIRWMKDSNVREYIEGWQPDTPPHIVFYDLRVDNKCNLACISCQPKYSSLWAKELQQDIPKTKIDLDFDAIASSTKVYLAGGEPFLIPEFIKLIERIAQQEQQPELVINTNLTKVGDKVKNLLSRIKNLTLTISVDSYGKTNEYHRWPMSWKKFTHNLEWIRTNLKCTLQFNTVIDAVSVVELHRLVDLEYLVDHWNLHVLTGPAALVVQNLPESIKETTIHKLEYLKTSKFYSRDPAFKTRVDNLIKQISQPGDSQMLSKFVQNLDQRRNINHVKYLGVNLI